MSLNSLKETQTRRAFAGVRSYKIWVRVIIIVVIVMGGKQSQILLRKLRTKSYLVGFAQYVASNRYALLTESESEDQILYFLFHIVFEYFIKL